MNYTNVSITIVEIEFEDAILSGSSLSTTTPINSGMDGSTTSIESGSTVKL